MLLSDDIREELGHHEALQRVSRGGVLTPDAQLYVSAIATLLQSFHVHIRLELRP